MEERRQVWWELVVYDRLQSLCFGRPCATSNRHSDTEFPDPTQGFSHDADGCECCVIARYQSCSLMQDHRAKYRLIALMEKVIEVVSSPISLASGNSKRKQDLSRSNRLPASIRSSENVSLASRLSADPAVKNSVPDSLLPSVPIQSLPLDPSFHPHVVSGITIFDHRLMPGHTSSRLSPVAGPKSAAAQPPTFRPSIEGKPRGSISRPLWRKLHGAV